MVDFSLSWEWKLEEIAYEFAFATGAAELLTKTPVHFLAHPAWFSPFSQESSSFMPTGTSQTRPASVSAWFQRNPFIRTSARCKRHGTWYSAAYRCTVELYNLGSGSWLALATVLRRKLAAPNARATDFGPAVMQPDVLRPSHPR